MCMGRGRLSLEEEVQGSVDEAEKRKVTSWGVRDLLCYVRENGLYLVQTRAFHYEKTINEAIAFED